MDVETVDVETEGVQTEDTAPEDSQPDGDRPDGERRRAAPVIHVPDRDLGRDDGESSADGDLGPDEDGSQPAKKKTRRGTRGGRNRRKKVEVAGAATIEADDPETDDAGVADEGIDTAATGVDASEPSSVPASAAKGISDPSGDPQPTERPEPSNGSENWEYTPMSEWDIEDGGSR